MNAATARSTTRDPAALPRALMTIAAVLLLWPGLELAEFQPSVLFARENAAIMGRFLSTFLPPRLDPEFLMLVFQATLETLALATAGMALALALALPLSLVVTSSISVSRIGPGRRAWLGGILRAPARGLLIFLRSIPEIVWALLFVRALGLGPAAGVAAIAINYAGMLGKVFFEIYESGDQRPARVILESGGGRVSAFCYGILPVALPELVSYSIYRWECAVRASVVMGFVGAGGLGQQMELSMKMLAGGEVSTMLATFFLLVLLADAVSAVLRRVFA